MIAAALAALAVPALAYIYTAAPWHRTDQPTAAPDQPAIAHEYWDDGHLDELHEWTTEDTALPAEMLATGEMPAVTEDEWWDYQPKHLARDGVTA